MKILATVLAALLASAPLAPAIAQAASADSSMMGDVSKTTFAKAAISSNQLEIQSSQLALEKASSAPVKEFATKMIADHTQAGENMKAALARSEGDLGSSKEMSAEDMNMLRDLKATSDANFDQAYIRLQAMAHEKAIALFQSYAAKPDDAPLGQFAQATLPTLQMHAEHLKQISGK